MHISSFPTLPYILGPDTLPVVVVVCNNFQRSSVEGNATSIIYLS
jgi:hypothetical protein